MSIVDVRKNMADALNRVAYRGDRIVLQRRGKGVAAIVPMEDLELLRKLEDEYWTKEALKVERKMKADAEKPVPFDEVEREIDRKKASGGRRSRKP